MDVSYSKEILDKVSAESFNEIGNQTDCSDLHMVDGEWLWRVRNDRVTSEHANVKFTKGRGRRKQFVFVHGGVKLHSI